MKKVSLILFTMVAMFSFSGCSTKLSPVNTKFISDLKDLSKVKSSEVIYVCKSTDEDKNMLKTPFYVNEMRNFTMYDSSTQVVLKEFLEQYFVKVEDIECNDRESIKEFKNKKVLNLYPTDARVSWSGLSFKVDSLLSIQNHNNFTTINITGEYILGAEVLKFERLTLGDERLKACAPRSIFKGLEENKLSIVNSLK